MEAIPKNSQDTETGKKSSNYCYSAHLYILGNAVGSVLVFLKVIINT